MKVLHIGLTVNGRGEGLSRAFKDLSSEYLEFGVSEALPQQIKGVKADLVFCQIQGDKIGNHSTNVLLNNSLQELRDSGAFVINWTGDIRQNYPHWMGGFNADLTCFSNDRDIGIHKGNSDYLQIGIDPVNFTRHIPNDEQGHDVVFMGNDYKGTFPLGSFRRQAVEALKSFDHGVYGNYKGAVTAINADPNNAFPMQSKESKIYNNSKIGISISHFDVPRYTSDRLFRAIGSGIMVLAQHYYGIEKEFMVGKHLETFRSIAEMKEKIRFYLENPDKRKEIAMHGYEHVQANFTYHNMVENIFELYNKHK
jgi:hypothetical protein